MSKLSSEAKVGLLVVLGIVLLGYMSIKVGKHEIRGDKGYKVHVYFDSAAGLLPDVPVEIAGVEVGRVSSISLEKGRARVQLLLRPEIVVKHDGQALIRTKGILGDKYVELLPGTPGAPALQDGEELRQGVSPADVDAILKMVGDIATDVRRITRSLAGVLGGEEGRDSLQAILENMKEMAEMLNSTVTRNNEDINRIIANLSHFSEKLREMGETSQGDVQQIVVAVRDASRQLEETLASASQITGKISRGEGTLGRLVNEDETIERLNETMSSLQEISDKINRGEGTLGRLIHEEDTVERLNAALTGIDDYVKQQERFKTYIDYRGEYLTEDSGVKSYVSLRIQPKEDKYYLLQLVDDPRGKESVTDTHTTVNGVTRWEHKVESVKDELKFSAQIAKRYYDLGLRGGLFESTGGVALDYYFLDDRLTLSLEAFDFDPDTNAHLKFKADYSPFPYIHLTTGYDDFLSDVGRESFFFGAGISFADEDIKALLTSIPLPSD
ncbi:MlaD family protein [Thermodesulfobacteriota bacterium]